MDKEPSIRPRKSGTPAGLRETLKKATTEMMILILLRRKSMYVYELMHEMQEHSGGILNFNTLYIAIYRLKEYGYVAETERVISGGHARIYFATTREGSEYLDQLVSEYLTTTAAVARIIALDPAFKDKGNADDYGEELRPIENPQEKVYEGTEKAAGLSSLDEEKVLGGSRVLPK